MQAVGNGGIGGAADAAEIGTGGKMATGGAIATGGGIAGRAGGGTNIGSAGAPVIITGGAPMARDMVRVA